MEKMNQAQKDFAATNINIVERFLSRRKLPESEYYDIVIFGYLRAVQRYLSNKDLQDFRFQTIANQAMHTELINHWRKQGAKKRSAFKTVSIEAMLEREMGYPCFNELAEDIEEKLLWNQIAASLSQPELEVLVLKRNGHTYDEIAEMKATHRNNVCRCIARIRKLCAALDW